MNLDTLLSKILSSPLASGAAGGLLSGGLLSALGSKGGRKVLGGAAKLGGVAAIGAIAYAGLKHYQAQQAPQPAARIPTAALPPKAPALERKASMMLAAMLSAARADGTFDESERQRIHQNLQDMGLAEADVELVLAASAEAADPHRIGQLAQTEDEAVEVYTASLLAIDLDHWAEQAYLRELRSALRLPDGLAAAVESEVQQRAMAQSAA